MKKYKKGNKHKRENHSFWASVFYRLEQLHRFHAICKEKKVFEDKVFTNQEKNVIFPFHQYWKTNTCQDGNNFQGANYVNLHYGSKTLKFEDIVRLKVMLHETIRNNDL